MALEQCCSSPPSQWSSPPSLFSETAQVTLQIQQPPGVTALDRSLRAAISVRRVKSQLLKDAVS